MIDERIPPQNLEAEQALIGAVIQRNEVYELAREILTDGDFSAEKHREIWRGIDALMRGGRAVDPITLCDALKPKLEQIGGAEYLAECASVGIPTAFHGRDYARIVREKAIQRALLSFGTALAAHVHEAPMPYSPEWTEELVTGAESDLAEIASSATVKPDVTKSAALKTVLWRLENGVEAAIPLGFPSLDRSFAGLAVGHLTILAARTSRGKTAFATNVALNIAKRGYPVAFFTLEQPATEVYERALGTLAMVDTFAVKRRGLRDDEAARLAQATADLDQRPLEILYRPSMRPHDVRLECRRLERELGPVKVAVVDYLGLMRGDRREKERWMEARGAVLALKEIAGELGIPVLLLAQINREGDDSHPPSMSHLRDTGSLEEHASNVILLWQKPVEHEPAYDDWQPIEAIIAKQRNGPAGIAVPMQFRKNWGAFE